MDLKFTFTVFPNLSDDSDIINEATIIRTQQQQDTTDSVRRLRRRFDVETNTHITTVLPPFGFGDVWRGNSK